MNFETKTVHIVAAHEFDKAIKDNFGRDFSIVANEEASNGDNLSFFIDGQITQSDQEKFARWFNGDDSAIMFSTHTLLDRMYLAGMIPSGQFIIEVSW